MASSSDNLITLGLTGMIGRQLVFRKRGNKLIVAKMPAKRTTELKASELVVRKRFKEASTYAKAAIKDNDIKAYYLSAAQPGQSAYNMAFADFFSVPEITEVDVENYYGRVGDKIGIKAIEDFKVVSVDVKLLNQDGDTLESGEALISINELDWFYTVKTVNNDLTRTKVVITATDLAGNATVEEAII